eukprot:jgi/Mesvir1/16499/Mv10052-RA.1
MQKAESFTVRSGNPFPSDDSFGYYHGSDKADRPGSGFSLFLERRCKRVFFVRHAEGFHNLCERRAALEGTWADPAEILLEKNSGREYWDARLTPEGEKQCARLRQEIKEREHPLDVQAVITSPLTRTLQTTELTFGRAGDPGVPPVIATELCRERIADYMCDGRRNVSELRAEFPGVDFSLVESDEDTLFHTAKEDDHACKERTVRFLEWLAKRPEQRLAVVTHSIFLKNLFAEFGWDVTPDDRSELRSFPKNAEMRGVMLCAHRPF